MIRYQYHCKCTSCEFSNELAEQEVKEGYEEECKQCGQRFWVTPEYVERTEVL